MDEKISRMKELAATLTAAAKTYYHSVKKRSIRSKHGASEKRTCHLHLGKCKRN